VFTHRFGRKIKLPPTVVIKHQIRLLMAQDEAKKPDAQLLKQSNEAGKPSFVARSGTKD
jgi:hypothetical protein